jgi:hypothetical protein
MRSLTIVFMLASLVIVGCGSSQTRANAPDSNDPSWSPPGEVNLAFGDSAQPQQVKAAAASMPQPNKSDVHKRSIHAAMY